MIFKISVLERLCGQNVKKFKNSRLPTDSRKLHTLPLKTEYKKNSIAIVSLLDLAPPESVCTAQPCEYLKNLSQRFTPCNGLYRGGSVLKGYLFSGLRYMKEKGLVEVYLKGTEICLSVCTKT